jgi:hypothetical protein
MRAIGVSAFFAVLAPILGILSVALIGWLHTHHSHLQDFFLSPGDLLDSVLYFGGPSAVAGLLFFATIYQLRARSLRIGLLWRATFGAAAFAVVVGAPLLARSIQYSHFSKNGLWFVALATICGLVVGLGCPSSWLVPDQKG